MSENEIKEKIEEILKEDFEFPEVRENRINQISELFDQEKQKLIGKIEKMKRISKNNIGSEYEIERQKLGEFYYNQAISDIISKLT